MNNYNQALTAAAPSDRLAVRDVWRARAAALPDLRTAELADLADALDAITPAGYTVTVSSRPYSYEVNAYRTADGYHGRQSRTYWQHGESAFFAYERTMPRTLADLIAADAELIEVQLQLRDLETRRSELARLLTV